MTTATGKPSAAQVQDFLAKRDLTVDLVRVFCVMLVVVIHSLMVGIGTVNGIHITDPAQSHGWFKYATWFLQIMPLFFVVGGFAAWQGWQGVVRRGQPWQEFFRSRVLRLAYPTLIWYAAMGGGLWLAAAIGAPQPLLAALTAGIGMPLWFLAAYLITQFCVPLMVRLHARHRYATVAVLLAGAVLVDVLRYTTGLTEIGRVNMLFIWLLVQQFGFFYADGTLQRIPRRVLPLIAVAAFGLVGLLGFMQPLLGLPRGYSPDMLDNLNPPTLPLVFIGVAHTVLLLLLKPLLDRLMRRRPMQGAVLFLGSRAMTIYLWHMIFVILIAALVLVLPLPQPDTAAWWVVRIPSILVTYGLIFLLSLGVARFERGPGRRHVHAAPGSATLVLIAMLTIFPPFYALEWQLNMWALLWGTGMLLAGVWLACGRRGVGRAAQQPAGELL